VIERALLHGVLHLVVPALAARLFWRRRWKRVAAALILMNLVDLDHLLATPVYDPGRCSLGFHPLHSWPAQVLWAGLAVWRPTRVVGVGALIHMALDGIDCAWMGG
jgi:hypothetical protein